MQLVLGGSSTSNYKTGRLWASAPDVINVPITSSTQRHCQAILLGTLQISSYAGVQGSDKVPAGAGLPAAATSIQNASGGASIGVEVPISSVL